MGLTNYAANPSFELDGDSNGRADGVVQTGGTLVGSPTFTLASGRTGGYAQRIRYTGQATDVATTAQIDICQPAAGTFAPGDIVNWSGWLKGAVSGYSVTLMVAWRTSAGGGIAVEESGILSISGSFARFSFTTPAAPATTSIARGRLMVRGIDNGDAIDVTLDDVTLTKASADPGYFDGSCRGIWTGTANASTSILVPHPLLLRGAE